MSNLSKESTLNSSKRKFLFAIPVGILAAVFVKFLGGRFSGNSETRDSEIKQYVSNLPEDSIYMPDPSRYKNL